MSRKLKSNIVLLLAAVIWGGAFVAQSVGNDIGSFCFTGVRSLIGVAVLIPVILLADRRAAERKPWPWRAGLLCGVFVTAATALQQFGLGYTTAGKAGFITALYIVLVPIISFLLSCLRRNREKNAASPVGLVQTVLSLAIAIVGMYFLCIVPGAERGGVDLGDILIFLCAIMFSLQILTIDRFAADVDCLKLSCIQFIVCGVVCTAAALIFERETTMPMILGAYVPLLYAGVLSCGVAYTLQMLGQRDSDPTVAALIMSLESVFAVLSGWLVLHEHLSVRELVGCLLMMCAIVLIQLPLAGLKKRKA